MWSTREGAGNTTVEAERDMLEMVQHRAARWSRGAWGIISVTALLNELNWQTLSDRRCDQRLSLFYKIINKDLNIPLSAVDLSLTSANTITRKSKRLKAQNNEHKYNLERIYGSDKHSPFWKGTVCRTVPDWNGLDSSVAEAGSYKLFKSRLAPARQQAP